jgi:hypothetical protein
VALLFFPHIWCGALMPFLALHELVDFVRFRTFASVVPGKVQRLYTSHGKGGTYHQVAYTFALPGAEGAGDATVDEAAFNRMAKGDPVTVRVLPGFRMGPQLLLEGARGPLSDSWKMALFIVGWDGLMSIIVWQAVVRPLRQRALVRHGAAVPGQITEKHATSSGKSRGYKVHYTYIAPAPGPGGQDMEYQRVMSVQEEDYDRLRAEDRVIVIYDPRKPHRSLVYRCADYEVLP